jgi:hypothetical protein
MIPVILKIKTFRNKCRSDGMVLTVRYGTMLIQHVLYLQKSRVFEAEQWFQKATELAPNDPTVYKQFGKTQHLSAPYCDSLNYNFACGSIWV